MQPCVPIGVRYNMQTHNNRTERENVDSTRSTLLRRCAVVHLAAGHPRRCLLGQRSGGSGGSGGDAGKAAMGGTGGGSGTAGSGAAPASPDRTRWINHGGVGGAEAQRVAR
jgi:hypothetical protein